MMTTIYTCLECLKNLALVSFPIIPITAQKVWNFLGFKDNLETRNWKKTIETHLIEKTPLLDPEILFKKVEDQEIVHEMDKLKHMFEEAKKKKEVSFTPLKDPVDIDQFKKLDLRVGVVLNAEAIAKSKKLLKLTVDLGFQKRTIVAGISLSYTPQEVIGKKVIVIANLTPATLMGIESHGMLLAGNWDGKNELLSLQNLPPGSVVS